MAVSAWLGAYPPHKYMLLLNRGLEGYGPDFVLGAPQEREALLQRLHHLHHSIAHSVASFIAHVILIIFIRLITVWCILLLLPFVDSFL